MLGDDEWVVELDELESDEPVLVSKPVMVSTGMIKRALLEKEVGLILEEVVSQVVAQDLQQKLDEKTAALKSEVQRSSQMYKEIQGLKQSSAAKDIVIAKLQSRVESLERGAAYRDSRAAAKNAGQPTMWKDLPASTAAAEMLQPNQKSTEVQTGITCLKVEERGFCTLRPASN